MTMKISSSNEVCQMYDTSADFYAKMMDSEIELPVYTKTFTRLHETIKDQQGALIDTACGTGHMLAMYHDNFDPERHLIGVDLSTSMTAFASNKLGSSARIITGDMCKLDSIDDDTAVAVLNFFALHHLDKEQIESALQEWYRVLKPQGQLFIATWEGVGAIDYGGESDVVALRYRLDELGSLVQKAGFEMTRSVVEPVEEFPMDAIYIDAAKV